LICLSRSVAVTKQRPIFLLPFRKLEVKSILKMDNISIDIPLDKLIYSQGFKKNSQVRPEIITEAEMALDMAMQLVEPAFVLERLPVQQMGQGKVKVGKTELNVGEFAHLLDQATEAFIYVTTIGRELEKAVSDLSRKGNFELAYWLDCAGVLALNSVDEKVWTMVESMAKDAGYGVGLSLNPGSLKGWAVEDQISLCSLVDISKVGVSVNSSFLLVPNKSASNLIGIGPGYPSDKVVPACNYCISEGNCWMKHARRGV